MTLCTQFTWRYSTNGVGEARNQPTHSDSALADIIFITSSSLSAKFFKQPLFLLLNLFFLVFLFPHDTNYNKTAPPLYTDAWSKPLTFVENTNKYFPNVTQSYARHILLELIQQMSPHVTWPHRSRVRLFVNKLPHIMTGRWQLLPVLHGTTMI